MFLRFCIIIFADITITPFKVSGFVPNFKFVGFLTLQCHVSRFDESELTHKLGEAKGDDCGEQEADEYKSRPIKRGNGIGVLSAEPAENDTDRAKHTAGTHTGIDSRAVHSHIENAGGERACYSGCYRGGNPYAGIFDYIGHLEHTCTNSL